MSPWIDAAFTAADSLFWRLLWVSLQGVGVTSLVWALCRFLPALSATSRCWLWWVVCGQLVVGLLWPEPWRQNLPLPSAANIVSPAGIWQAPWRAADIEPIDEGSQSRQVHRYTAWSGEGQADASPFRIAIPARIRWSSWLGILWCATLLFVTARLAREYRRLGRMLASSTPASQDLHACLQAEAADLGILRIPRLLLSEAVASPMLCGALRPAIVLPTRALPALDAVQIRLALRHELLHLRRGDLIWGWVPALAQRLFCFNPLAALAAREYDLAREAAVDAALLRGTEDTAAPYGRLLISLGVAVSPAPALATASPTYKTLHRRLTMLSQHHIPSRSTSMVAAAALLLAVGCSAPLATAEAPKETHTSAKADDHAGSSYVYSDGEHLLSFGTEIHMGRGKNGSIVFGNGAGHRTTLSFDDAKAGGQPRLWYADAGVMYLLEDAATLARIDQLLQPMRELGRQQGELGEQQGALGERQGALGAQQGELGARQGTLGAQVAHLATRRMPNRPVSDAEEKELDRQLDALDAQMETLGQQQEELGRQQEALGEQQSVLGERQEALGEQQRQAGEQAQSQIETLMKQAIADGRARRVETAALR
jgi:beta-lactamase regulating signal transducer with metallopeptidase domain